MPKIIEHLRETLLAEARKQVETHGFAATTIRSVAAACNVGVGTVYNYFPSKEMLIATFVADEWRIYLDAMKALPCDEAETLLHGIYDGLLCFAAANEKLFSDADAAKQIASGSAVRHKLLRSQLAALLLPLCQKHVSDTAAFTADFIAEALIGWSVERVDFAALYPVLKKVIK
jgi:AcrR family transcriptional regulator